MFINLPVSDLEQTMKFFTSLGFSFNPQFTDENAACMVISEENYAMLLRRDFFKSFTSREIPDSRKFSESIISLTAENREEVDQMMDKVILAGGHPSGYVQDLGWMYGRGFTDPDGHLWEIFYMDMSSVPAKM